MVKFYPSRRKVIQDMYPSLLLLTFAILLGVSNLLGTLEPRGAFASLMAWGATFTAPFALYEVLKPFWKRAAVVDASGVFWATTNHVETGFVPRQEIAKVDLERTKGLSTLRLSLTSQKVIHIPIRASGPCSETLAGIRAALALT